MSFSSIGCKEEKFIRSHVQTARLIKQSSGKWRTQIEFYSIRPDPSIFCTLDVSWKLFNRIKYHISWMHVRHTALQNYCYKRTFLLFKIYLKIQFLKCPWIWMNLRSIRNLLTITGKPNIVNTIEIALIALKSVIIFVLIVVLYYYATITIIISSSQLTVWYY